MEKKIILWTKELATGIAWQDFQHRQFLTFTNALFDDFFKNKGLIDLEPSIVYMERYAKEHFSLEEQYMDMLKYPETKEHKEQHSDFREFVESLKQLERNTTVEGARLCNKINNWFAEHIRVTDKDLGAFLNDQGQK